MSAINKDHNHQECVRPHTEWGKRLQPLFHPSITPNPIPPSVEQQLYMGTIRPKLKEHAGTP